MIVVLFILYNCGFVSLYAIRDHKKWFSDTAKRAAMKLKKQYGVWIKTYSDALGLAPSVAWCEWSLATALVVKEYSSRAAIL